MAGLDFLTSEDAQLGLALLAAAGPSPYPASFGQRLAGALQTAQAGREGREDRLTKRQLLQSQMAENAAQTAYRQQELALAAKKQANIDAWLRGGGGLMGDGGAAPAGGLMGAAPAAAGGGGGGLLSSLTPERLAQGAVLGVPGITGVAEAYKLANPEMKEANGYFYNPRTVAPGVNQEMREAQLQTERDKADIAAGRQRITFVGPNGEQRQGWADEVDPRRPTAPRAPGVQTPTRPMIGPGAGYRTEGAMKATAAEGNDARAYARELKAIETDLATPGKVTDPASRAVLQQEAANIRAQMQRYSLPNDASGTPLIGPGAGAAPTSSAPGVKTGLSPQELADIEVKKAGDVRAATERAELAVKNEANAPKNLAMRNATVAQAERVMSKVDEALGQVGAFTSGAGSLLSPIPGTSARNLAKTLETIKANLGFAELQAMRQASPTGGALGAIAVQELEALQSTIASLDQGQDPAQLARNLAQIRKHYDAWKKTTLETPLPGVPPAPPAPPPPPAPPAPAPAPRGTQGPSVSGRIGDAPASSSGWTPPPGVTIRRIN